MGTQPSCRLRIGGESDHVRVRSVLRLQCLPCPLRPNPPPPLVVPCPLRPDAPPPSVVPCPLRLKAPLSVVQEAPPPVIQEAQHEAKSSADFEKDARASHVLEPHTGTSCSNTTYLDSTGQCECRTFTAPHSPPLPPTSLAKHSPAQSARDWREVEIGESAGGPARPNRATKAVSAGAVQQHPLSRE